MHRLWTFFGNMNVAAWAAAASWGSVFVAFVACVFAGLAWYASYGQLKELRAGAATEKKRIATEHVAAVITDLTTGDVASARERVTATAIQFADLLPPGSPAGGAQRDHLLNDESSDEATKERQAVFLSLWALHRASTLTEELDQIDPAIQTILAHHIRQMVTALDNLGRRLTEAEQKAFTESAASAQAGVLALDSKLHISMDKPLASLAGWHETIEVSLTELEAE